MIELTNGTWWSGLLYGVALGVFGSFVWLRFRNRLTEEFTVHVEPKTDAAKRSRGYRVWRWFVSPGARKDRYIVVMLIAFLLMGAALTYTVDKVVDQGNCAEAYAKVQQQANEKRAADTVARDDALVSIVRDITEQREPDLQSLLDTYAALEKTRDEYPHPSTWCPIDQLNEGTAG